MTSPYSAASTVRLALEDARELLASTLRRAGLPEDDLPATVDHLMDCELRGLGYGGLARALTVAERLDVTDPPGSIEVVHRTPVSVTVAGGDRIGYAVAQRTTELGIEIARSSGVCVAGAHDTWYTGMFSYYLEQAAAAGLVGIAAGNAGAFVAPHGATEGLLGTNPIAIAFPTLDNPVIWDIGTAVTTHAEVKLAGRRGEKLPPGIAYAPDGAATVDPREALSGALTVWGGHKGSGLSLAVHLLGMMTGSPALPRTGHIGDLGFLLVLIDPGVLGDAEDYRRRVGEHARRIRDARPVDPERPVRVPFDRSLEERREAIARGWIEVDPLVVERLTERTVPLAT